MSDRPVYLSRLALPVSWEVLDGAPSPEDCGKTAWSNAGVLSFLLHGIEVDAAQRPADERLAEALAPLRIKLDTIIEMLGRLTYRDVALPPVHDIELGMDRIAVVPVTSVVLGGQNGTMQQPGRQPCRLHRGARFHRSAQRHQPGDLERQSEYLAGPDG
jgi:hypothetical protein